LGPRKGAFETVRPRDSHDLDALAADELLYPFFKREHFMSSFVKM